MKVGTTGCTVRAGSGPSAAVLVGLFLLPLAAAADGAEPASLSGTVRYDDGSPVVGADLAVIVEYACTDTQCELADENRSDFVADAEGRWSVSVLPGGLTVVAWAEGGESVQGSLTVRPGESREVPLVVQRSESSVTVRVHALDAVDGMPVNAHVSVNFRGEQGLHDTYETTTVPGTVRVWVHAAQYEDDPCGPPQQDSQHEPVMQAVCEQQVNKRTYHTWARLFTAEAGASLDVEARLVPLADVDEAWGMHGEVVGWVVDDGRGVPDAVVTAYNEATLEWGHARTDQHGAYRLGVTAGHIVLHAAAVESRVALWGLDVPADGVAHANLMLAPEAGTCCWKQPANYSIPAEGPAPGPPAWMPIPVKPKDSILSQPHMFDMERRQGTGCFDWCQSFQAVKADLGPYDPSIDLSSTSGSASESVTALPVGLAVVAVAAAGGRKRR